MPWKAAVRVTPTYALLESIHKKTKDSFLTPDFENSCSRYIFTVGINRLKKNKGKQYGVGQFQ